MDALYFRLSIDRQAIENQLQNLLEVAEGNGSGGDWTQIRELLSLSIIEEQMGSLGSTRTICRLNPHVVERLADLLIYV